MSSSSDSAAERAEVPFGSSGQRLTLCQWAAVAAIVGPVLLFAPAAWQRIEPLPAQPAARVPYSLSSDYWAYGRYAALAGAEGRDAVVGDSVVWGHYVVASETLPAQLNRLLGRPQFANLGLDGVHPAALAGLVEHYGGDIAGRRVLLHCNLLWISSKRHDLQIEKPVSFNHPDLVPQLTERIPCYAEPYAERLRVVVGREVPFFAWGRHLQIAYFGGADLPRWTVDHPFENPLGRITLELPSPDEPPSPPPAAVPWTQSRYSKFSAAWVNLEDSYQWRSFCRTIDLLEGRGNRVFVVVGPFNEHMLVESSRQVYRQRLAEVQTSLAKRKIPRCAVPLLPSDEYADASHPLAPGYAAIARALLDDPAFARWCAAAPPDGTDMAARPFGHQGASAIPPPGGKE